MFTKNKFAASKISQKQLKAQQPNAIHNGDLKFSFIKENGDDSQEKLFEEIRSLQQKIDQFQATQTAILAHLNHGG